MVHLTIGITNEECPEATGSATCLLFADVKGLCKRGAQDDQHEVGERSKGKFGQG